MKEYGAEDSPIATVGTMIVIRTNSLGELVLGCEDATNEHCHTAQVFTALFVRVCVCVCVCVCLCMRAACRVVVSTSCKCALAYVSMLFVM